MRMRRTWERSKLSYLAFNIYKKFGKIERINKLPSIRSQFVDYASSHTYTDTGRPKTNTNTTITNSLNG